MEINSRIERIQKFNSKKSPLGIVVQLPLPAEVKENIRQKALRVSQNEFPSAEILFPLWEELLTYHHKNDLDDDNIKYLYPLQYDQGIAGAMFGAEMHFLVDQDSEWGWCSSNSMPFEDKSYDELLMLKFNPENEWLQRMRKDLLYFSEKSFGRFNVSTTVTIDGFNFAHQIRGSKFFEDIYDRPEELKALLNLAADMVIKVIEFQRDATGESCENGSIIHTGLYPGKTIAMSVDTYNMCSPATYEEFGRPYQQRLIDYFGGGAFHLHGNGRHLLPELAKLSGFVQVSICDDGAGMRAFDDRENIRKLAGNLLIDIFSCNKDEFEKAIYEKSLVPARYNVKCDNIEEAKRLLEKFRNYTI